MARGSAMWRRNLTPLALAAALGLTAMSAGTARADALDPRVVPAGAKWVAHLDMSAVQRSKVWEAVWAKADERSGGRVKQQLEGLGTLLGTRVPEDIRGVTVTGSAFGPESAVVVIHAVIDPQRLVAALKLNATYETGEHAGQPLHTWIERQGDRRRYAAIVGGSNVVMGEDRDAVTAAVDVVAGRAPSMSADATLLKDAGDGAMLFVSGENLSELARSGAAPDNPIVAFARSAKLSVAEKGDDLSIRGSLTTTDADKARQAQTILEGMRAMVMLGGSGEAARPAARTAADAVARAVVTLEGTTLRVELPVPVETIRTMIEQADGQGPRGRFGRDE